MAKEKRMDIYCQHCGEPYEVLGLWDLESDEHVGARQDFLDGKGCPCCGWGTKEIQKSSEKAENDFYVEEIARERHRRYSI